MNKKIILIATTSILLTTSVIDCNFSKVKGDKIIETEAKSITIQKKEAIEYKLEENVYINKEMKIKYPQIKDLGDTKKQEIINNLIKEKAIAIYDETLNGLEEGQTYEVDGTYEIKLKSNEILSVAYTSYNNITPSAYPYNLFYTINIDINKGQELTINDLIPKIDEKFIEIFKKGKYVGTVEEKYQEQLMKFVYKDYINDENLIDAVKNAYVYVTKDTIGISILVPHVAGDYVPIEIKKDDLKKLK